MIYFEKVSQFEKYNIILGISPLNKNRLLLESLSLFEKGDVLLGGWGIAGVARED